jgi:hypothetical protein
MPNEGQFFGEWRAASRAASEAERAVSDAFMRYFNNRGPLPPKDQIDDAKRRRALADDLLMIAMGRVHAVRNINKAA